MRSFSSAATSTSGWPVSPSPAIASATAASTPNSAASSASSSSTTSSSPASGSTNFSALPPTSTSTFSAAAASSSPPAAAAAVSSGVVAFVRSESLVVPSCSNTVPSRANASCATLWDSLCAATVDSKRSLGILAIVAACVAVNPLRRDFNTSRSVTSFPKSARVSASESNRSISVASCVGKREGGVSSEMRWWWRCE